MCARNTVLCFALLTLELHKAHADEPSSSDATISLEELIALPEDKLEKIDIAALNLACVEGLPNAGSVDRAALLKQLDAWAAYVAYETRRHFYRFQSNPEEYNHHFGDFAMLIMAVTLQEDLNVHYNPQQISYSDHEAFQHPREVFIPGLLSGTGGNCASLPVMYVAVGRRLGYPLKLVRAKGHFFVHWEEGEKTFNIEATARGLATPNDAHYREGRYELWPRVRSSGYYLQPLTPKQELSSFLQTRGDCLLASGYLVEAHQAFRRSLEVDPTNAVARYAVDATEERLQQEQVRQHAIAAEAAFQQHEARRRRQPQLIVPGMPTIRVPVVTARSVQPIRTMTLPPPVEFPPFREIPRFDPTAMPAGVFRVSPVEEALRAMKEHHRRLTDFDSRQNGLPAAGWPGPMPGTGVPAHVRHPAPGMGTQYIEVPLDPIPLRLHEGVQP